jgi:hypothetical protein
MIDKGDIIKLKQAVTIKICSDQTLSNTYRKKFFAILDAAIAEVNILK